MNTFLYAAFGTDEYINETVYSILSLYHISAIEAEKTRIVILTNNAAAFGNVFEGRSNIILESISNETVDSWLEGTGYMPRLKIKSLQYFFKKYKDNVVFIDSDTFFMKSPEPIFNAVIDKKFVMYAQMPSLGDFLEDSKKKDFIPHSTELHQMVLLKDIEKEGFITDGAKRFDIPMTFRRYNSGIIGMNICYEHLLDKALELSDLIYKKYNFWCAEEFSVSFFLQNAGEVILCDELIYHYFHSKWCRFIVADKLKYFHGDDINGFKKAIDEKTLENYSQLNFEYSEIPNFVFFMLSFVLKVDDAAGLRFFLGLDSHYSKVSSDLRTNKKFVLQWKFK